MSQLAGVMQVGTHQADVLRAVTIRYRMELNESRLRDLLAELSVDRPDIDDIARRFDEACSHTKSPIPGSPAARDGALAYV